MASVLQGIALLGIMTGMDVAEFRSILTIPLCFLHEEPELTPSLSG